MEFELPMTIAMFPLLHNTIPVVGSESYLKKPSLGYHRLPALEKLKRETHRFQLAGG